jgi:hypothetical protein
MNLNDKDVYRFQSYLRPQEGCWGYKGFKRSDGYKQFVIKKRPYQAHRISWMMFNESEIPEGLVVRHKCDNRECVNPLHLEIGTVLDNVRDRDTRGRNYESNKVHCPKGHAYTDKKSKRNKRVCLPCAKEREREKRLLRRSL